MSKPKLVRITTVPLSLEKLLEGQLSFMNSCFEVIAVSSDLQGLKKVAEKEGVRYFFAPLTRKITPLQDLIATLKLYHFLKKEQPMIVHTHTPKAGLVGMLAAWLAKVPIRMHTVAGLPLMESNGLKKRLLQWVEKRTYSFATQVYPNSKGLKEYILEQKFTGVENLKIIGNGSSNGIDLNYFKIHSEIGYKASQKEKFTIPSDDFTFIFVGRLVKDKGIVELVEAFVKLQKETPDVSLLLIGPFEQALDPLPGKSLHIIHNHPKIFFTGYQEDVRPYFSASDLLVFPSYREGFPNVVLQALAMELPVIATDINGCNELITEGHNGWIIPVKDSGILYATMKDAYFQRDKLWALKNNTRNSVLKYDRLAVWESLLKEYQHLLDGIS